MHRFMGLALVLVAGSIEAQNFPTDVMVAHFVDVGQGDAAVLEFSCGVVLIDVGGDGVDATGRLIAHLEGLFRERPELNRTINTIIITHNHVDHTSSLTSVRRAFTVRHVVENGMRGSSHDPGDSTLRTLAREVLASRATVLTQIDDEMIVGDLGLSNPEIDPVNCQGTDPVITVLSADLAENPGWSRREFDNKNNHSVVVRVDFGDASFLFTGDLEDDAIETMAEYYAETPWLDVDVYQVGHHGSDNGTTEDLVHAMSPEIAIFSMGTCEHRPGMFDANSFGHPRARIVGILMDAITRRRSQPKQVMLAAGVGAFHRATMRDAIYGTAWDGTIRIRATREGEYRVTVERLEGYGRCAGR